MKRSEVHDGQANLYLLGEFVCLIVFASWLAWLPIEFLHSDLLAQTWPRLRFQNNPHALAPPVQTSLKANEQPLGGGMCSPAGIRSWIAQQPLQQRAKVMRSPASGRLEQVCVVFYERARRRLSGRNGALAPVWAELSRSPAVSMSREDECCVCFRL